MHLLRTKRLQAQTTSPQPVVCSSGGPQVPSTTGRQRRDHGQSVAGALQRQAAQLMPAIEPPYRSLKHENHEIRLLNIHPGGERDPIKCTMVYTSMYTQHQLPYETVSYYWGAPSRTVVEINNCPVNTTSSAAEVLRRVRRQDNDRLIWIDAICINQREGNDEKGKQVAIMSEIYRNSKANIVWLGNSLCDAARVEETVRLVLADARNKTCDFKNFWRITHPNSLKREAARDGTLLSRKIDLRSLKDLFASPWFGRIWVVQEAALAPRNICHFGPVTFQLSDILRVAVWMRYNVSHIPPDLAASHGLRRASELWYLADHDLSPPEFHHNGCRMPLATVYQRMQDFDASDPHDRIYALLGFLLHRGQHLIELVPDYKKNISDLNRDATRAMIEESHGLDILKYLSVKAGEQPSQTRSWVVPFDRTWRNIQRAEPLRPIFYADSMSKVPGQTMHNANPDVLVLHGFEADIVKWRTHCSNKSSRGDLENESAPTALTNAATIYQALSVQYPSRCISEEMAATLVGGANSSGQRLIPHDFQCFSAFMNYLQEHNALPPRVLPWKQSEASKLTEPTRMAIQYMSAAWRACLHRRFFVTSTGRIGIGPGGLKDGDIITVLKGSRAPYALRRLSEDRFSLIGECYVYGMMEGQIVRQRRAEQPIVFYIV